MTDETPKDEIEIEIEKTDDSGEHEEPETETTEEDSPSFEYRKEGRPYIQYTASPRRGSIWNSPIGLAATFFIASKAIDLAYRVFIEREKTKRTEHQKQK